MADENNPMLNPEKDPEDWTTGNELMKEEFNENWTEAEASKKIDELQTKTGRGKKS